MKYIFNIINSVCIVLMAYFAVDMVYKTFVPQTLMAQNRQQMQKEEQTVKVFGNLQKLPQINPMASQVITKRNLFKVEVEGSKKDTAPVALDEKLEPTTLSLVLHGTVVGPDETYAVIEDKKIRKQDLYNVGDKVQDAEIKEILRHRVILLFQGKKQVLVMEDKPSSAPGVANLSLTPPSFAPAVLPSIQNIDPAQLPQFASNLMRQIKFRQHLTDGEPDGLMIYGIRPSSIFRKVGLQNGDIIQQVNGTPVLSEADAISLMGEVIHSDQAKLTLLRRGKVEEVVYNIPEGLQMGEE